MTKPKFTEWLKNPSAYPVPDSIKRIVEVGIQTSPHIKSVINSPFWMDMARSLQALAEAQQEAERLSQMIHSEDEGFDSIQKYIESHPIDAHVLVNLIGIERGLSESALEKSLRKERTAAAVEAKKAQRAETERIVIALAEPYRRTRSKANTAAIVQRELQKQNRKLNRKYIEEIFTANYPGKSWKE